MEKIENQTLIISSILEKVLEAKITLDEFEEQWKRVKIDSTVSECIYDDVVEAIIHTPTFIFSGKIDFQMWRNQYEYAVVLIDKLQVSNILEPKRWLGTRAYVLKNLNDFNEIAIKELISKAII